MLPQPAVVAQVARLTLALAALGAQRGRLIRNVSVLALKASEAHEARLILALSSTRGRYF
jgi:hypothetical protein